MPIDYVNGTNQTGEGRSPSTFVFPFWLYKVLCWITHPFRLLMPGYRHEYFAIRLLFWNSYKASFVTAQAMLESGKFTSAVYKENKNCFGMRRSIVSHYDHFENRGFAGYDSIYDGIYDYYDLVKNKKRSPQLAVALEQYPHESFDASSKANMDYVNTLVYKYQAANYYGTDSAVSYAANITTHSRNHHNNLGLYFLNWVLCVCGAVWLLSYLPYRAGQWAKNQREAFKRNVRKYSPI